MATKALKRFILLAVLCLWATPAWAAVTCYVVAGATNCWLTGPGNDINDIYVDGGQQFGILARQSGTSNWVFGNIDPSLQPNPGSGGCSIFNIGDDVTATDLTSKNENVEWTLDATPRIQNNATLTLGEKIADWGRNGARWHFNVSAGNVLLMSADWAGSGVFNCYDSKIFVNGPRWIELRAGNGSAEILNSSFSWDSVATTRNISFGGGLCNNLIIKKTYFSNMGYVRIDGSPSVIDEVFFYNMVYGPSTWAPSWRGTVILTNADWGETTVFDAITNSTGDMYLIDPKQEVSTVGIVNNASEIQVKFSVDIFVGDKDTEPESGVSVILKRSNLVKGSSGNSVFLCTTSHTSTADTTPITGADWADYWRVFFSGSTEVTVAGGDHRTGVAYEADAERFNVLTGTSGYIAQQQVTFKKWSTTSEYLDAWLHELKAQKTNFETMTEMIYINEQKDLWYVLKPGRYPVAPF